MRKNVQKETQIYIYVANLEIAKEIVKSFTKTLVSQTLLFIFPYPSLLPPFPKNINRPDFS